MLTFQLFVLAVELYAAIADIISASETRKCVSAFYYYGVVSVELVCPPDLALPGTTKCKHSAVRKVCQDLPDPEYVNCDPMVDIYRAADYYDPKITRETPDRNETERFPVSWLLEPQKDPAYYYRLRDKKLTQYVYRVNDTNVKPEHCATLLAMVSDRDDETTMGHKWGKQRYIEHTELTYWHTTKLPLPQETGERGGVWFIYARLYRVRRNAVLGHRRIFVKVNYMVRYKQVKIVTYHGTGKPTIYRFRDTSSESKIKKEGLTILKKDFGITPTKVEIGDHTLVCYRKFPYPKPYTLERTPCSTYVENSILPM